MLGSRLCSLGLTIALVGPTAAQAWTKGYVVEWLEPAMYYGAPEGGGGATPGTDCPDGINPALKWRELLGRYGYRDPARIDEINSAEYPRKMFKTHWAFRGPHMDNVYENPTIVPDQGLIEVTGKLAYGFDLDGNPNTGFTGVDGTPGVDNNFYRVSGCILAFRGPHRRGARIAITNEAMQNGLYQILVVVSGAKDPVNDDDVTVALYTSDDRMVKDANGKIAADYTFRVDAKPTYHTVFKAKIKDGVLTSDRTFLFRTHDNTDAEQYNVLDLYKAKVRWELNADGSMSGFVGGYRDWSQTYLEKAGGDVWWGNATGAGTREDLGHYDLTAWYQALRRNADGLPDPKTGKNRGISTVYRFSMVPAFIVTPNADRPLEVALGAE